MIIAIDFDGTCVTHDYPRIGKDIGAVPILKRLTDEGHQLMLWTMRSNKPEGVEGNDTLLDAVKWFEDNGIPLWGINENPEQAKSKWTTSNKQFAQLYIDDAAMGCPLLQEFKIESVENMEPIKFPIGRPFVNWEKVEDGLVMQGILKPLTKENNGNETTNNV